MAPIGKITVPLTAMVAVLVMGLWQSTMGHSEYCSNEIITMSSRLGYITAKSSTPPPPCCSQLATGVGSQPRCLCEALDGGSSLSANINQTLALALPNACRLQTPSASRCNNVNGYSPGGSPVKTVSPSIGVGNSSDASVVNKDVE
ncbi:hypothetical protein FNV43_RR23366 [Rhamnella rubrinervis]|uniref:Bifunctional inhibitor/plant lipid transfer protein/seed storage helical domain-containing protein n=1 Tax=Rhamnella rubrinervis TaxID=2594499 RepID=A0A8K0DXY8_9ROSA|nr:hypothetical protein FNV43_RR23366 [Rhamnella rubrinervis]